MRDCEPMRGARDQPERIDLIEVDSAIFGETAAIGPRQPAGPRRVLLKAVGVVAVIAVAAVVWWPRSTPPEWQVFQPAVVPAAGLTEELVFDDPPGTLVTADLAPRPVDVKPELGYVFAEPGGTMLTRRWASFRATSTNLPEAPASGDVANVSGAPAEVRRIRVRHYIEWGPLAGHIWTATTNRFDEAEAIEFANHVAIIEERPALAHRYDLGEMQPVGSTAALDVVVMLTSLLAGDRVLGPVAPTMLTWATAATVGLHPVLEGELSLSSIPAPADALPLVEFVLGDGQAITVHGLPAVIIDSKELGPVVAWLEDGRLIMVAGDLAENELIAMAESVRPATAGEWRVVGRTAARGEDIGFGFDLRESVTLYQVVDPDTGNTFTIISQPVVGPPLLATCITERTASGEGTAMNCNTAPLELPLLTTLELSGRRFVLAVVDITVGDTAELRIKLAEGTWTLPLADFGADVPGWAVATLLPTDYGVIQLVAEGEVVAAI